MKEVDFFLKEVEFFLREVDFSLNEVDFSLKEVDFDLTFDFDLTLDFDLIFCKIGLQKNLQNFAYEVGSKSGVMRGFQKGITLGGRASGSA